jgi:hypothetical protein
MSLRGDTTAMLLPALTLSAKEDDCDMRPIVLGTSVDEGLR